MIKLYRARKEFRKRDLKRLRYVLEIGKKKYHLTQDEVALLIMQGLRSLHLIARGLEVKR